MSLYKKPLPSACDLHSRFEYDSLNGTLRYKARQMTRNRPSTRSGRVVGYITTAGYLQVTIGTDQYLVHRLIWVMMTGESPPDLVDHINGNRADNRWSNLRLARHSENLHNMKLRQDNPTGIKGVGIDQRDGSYQVSVTLDGVRYRKAVYSSLADAERIANEFRERHHREFARYE